MSFYDFFFPEQAQATHLRSIARQSRRPRPRAKASTARTDELSERVSALEADLGFVSLLLATLMGQLDERGHVTRDDLKNALKELDELDGVKDGRLDVSALRGYSV